MLTTLHEYRRLSQGQSYWKVSLRTTSRVLSELDGVDWIDDLVSTGDVAHIKEVCLCTPVGEAHLPIERPYSAFKFNRGIMPLFGNVRIPEAQIIGRVDSHNGDCIACIWDIAQQRLYTDFETTIHDFGSWRPGITPVGELAYKAMGVQL